MTIELTQLPYKKDALEPYISARTLDYHYGKHHQAYVDKLNDAIRGSELEGKSLDQVILRSNYSKDDATFNNAAQVWNHTFLWNSMSPNGGGRAEGPLGRMIDESFGSYDEFRTAFKAAATGLFGSGWAWLIRDDKGLRIETTRNADTPLVHDWQPLLTLDVWEHAYYLDFQNDRAGYVDAFLDHLVDWEFARSNLDIVSRAA